MFIGREQIGRIAIIGILALGFGACATGDGTNRAPAIETSARFDADIARYTQLHAENPDDLLTLIHLSRSLRDAGRGDEAIALLERAERSFGSDTYYLTELGNAHLVSGDVASARRALDAAIARDQDNWRAHAALGVALDMERNYPKARSAYLNALNSCPNSAALLNNLALSESYSGEFAASMSHLTKAMQAQPGSLRIRRNWVVLSTLETRCPECEIAELARMARSLHPQDWGGAATQMTCTNETPRSYALARADENPDNSRVTSAEIIVAELGQYDFFDMRVLFEFDSATLTPDAYEALDELGKAINSNSLIDYNFRLEGHADARGGEEYNQDLSERRAAAVRDYLAFEHGIDTDRLESIGFGERRLADPTDPENGVNRRVRVVKLAPPPEFPVAGL